MAIFKNPRDRAQFSYLSRQMFPGDTKIQWTIGLIVH
jgi:hypothetical protein